MNNTITASAMNGLMHCPRNFFWSHEVGLQRESSGVALRFGSAWHRSMEARWKGASYDEALALAIPEGIDLGAYDCATLAGLLAGYYDYYGPSEQIVNSVPEIQFDEELCKGWRMQGKIDNLGVKKDGSHALVESKTTGDSVDPDSEYWLRLTFNLQVFQYVDASIKLGWDVSEVLYDVCRKPSIRPKEVTDLDKQGRKIVVDSKGKRVFATKKIKVKVGKGKKAKEETKEVEDLDKPLQSGSPAKGLTVKSHTETPDEFCDRLWRDTVARPSFYFVRREVPILEGDLEMFRNQRMAIVKMVEHLRSQEHPNLSGAYDYSGRDQEAWPRNVSNNTCTFCQYKSFCLQNITIDLNNLPQGYSIKQFNPELEYAATTEDSTSAA